MRRCGSSRLKSPGRRFTGSCTRNCSPLPITDPHAVPATSEPTSGSSFVQQADDGLDGREATVIDRKAYVPEPPRAVPPPPREVEPPPAKVIKGMEELGFRVTHIYGMTELQGPSTLCAPQDGWERLPLEERAGEAELLLGDRDRARRDPALPRLPGR